MAVNSPTIHTIDEAALQSYQHSPADIEAYATYLGIDLEHERDDDLFFFNSKTGESVWDHPSDQEYFKQVEEARAARVHVPVSLSLQPGAESGVTVVGTNLAGAVVATMMVRDPKALAFGHVEDGLRESMSLATGTVPRFVLLDATLLGYSQRSRSVADVFGL
jgi:hypothetical protein